jgi:hypothetical protein
MHTPLIRYLWCAFYVHSQGKLRICAPPLLFAGKRNSSKVGHIFIQLAMRMVLLDAIPVFSFVPCAMGRSVKKEELSRVTRTIKLIYYVILCNIQQNAQCFNTQVFTFATYLHMFRSIMDHLQGESHQILYIKHEIRLRLT